MRVAMAAMCVAMQKTLAKEGSRAFCAEHGKGTDFYVCFHTEDDCICQETITVGIEAYETVMRERGLKP